MLLLHAPASLRIDLAQPVVVATAWQSVGLLAWVILALTLIAAGIAYAAIIAKPPPLGATILTAAVTLATLWFFSPLFSSDLYAYATYGELARNGLSPYHHVSSSLGDPLIGATLWQWSNVVPVCVYGEGFVQLARAAVSLAAPFGIAAQLNVFRLLSVIALLVATAFAAFISPPQQQRFVAAAIALNPIALWAANEGHNDTIMLAVVLGGLVVARFHRMFGTFVITCATLIKLPALAAALVATVHGTRNRLTTMQSATGLLVGLSLVALASREWWRGLHDNVMPHGHYAPMASPQGLLFTIANALAGNEGIALIITIALLATAAAAVVVAAWRRWRNEPIDAYALIALAAWLAIPNPYPWYLLWILPIAAFASDRRIVACVITLGFASLVRYIPDAVAAPSPAINALLSLIATAPYALLAMPRKKSAEAFGLGADVVNP